MANFSISVGIKPRPWPFKWGPFCRDEVRYFDVDEARILISQREGQCMNQSPVVIDCYSGPGECTTTMDFRGSSRFKRKTEI